MTEEGGNDLEAKIDDNVLLRFIYTCIVLLVTYTQTRIDRNISLALAERDRRKVIRF